jgi:hypothetical protein
VKNVPYKGNVENFWREIYEKKVPHNGEACWIKDQYQKTLAWSGAQYVNKRLQKH